MRKFILERTLEYTIEMEDDELMNGRMFDPDRDWESIPNEPTSYGSDLVYEVPMDCDDLLDEVASDARAKAVNDRLKEAYRFVDKLRKAREAQVAAVRELLKEGQDAATDRPV